MRIGLGTVVVFLSLSFFLAVPSTPVQSQAVSLVTTQAATEVGTFDRLSIWIYQKQREFHRSLTSNLREFSRTGELTIALTLIGASFLYGFFHAAGPGHGKAVMTSYLVTHRETMKRGVTLAVAAAFCQGLVAIILVYGLMTVFGFLPRETQGAVTWSERASFALVALVGAYLLYRGGRGLFRRIRQPRSATRTESDHGSHQAHSHSEGECCGHTHMPGAQEVAKASDLKSKIGVVLSIGIRPCTGAVIILVFAKAVSLAWIGVAAVIAMSAGTALAVSSLATAAIGARNLARYLSLTPPKFAGHAADLAAAAGGALILFLGLSLLSAAFGPAHPLMG